MITSSLFSSFFKINAPQSNFHWASALVSEKKYLCINYDIIDENCLIETPKSDSL